MSMLVEPPSEYRIGNRQRIVRSDLTNFDGDPRGIVWLFEPPSPRARYVISVDSTQGRSGWNRYSRGEDDTKVDNGAIIVLRMGRGEPGHPKFLPDVQVAEYAAPIDPYDLASVVNCLGRLYCGRDEDSQALCIIEVHPGPGGPTQRTLQEKYGYTNLYHWQYLDTGEASTRKAEYGWYSTKQSMQHLWTKGLRFLHRKQVLLKSPYLVEELADCEMDLVRLRGAAASGGHDDRATALLLAIWAGHNWTFSIEPDQTTRAQEGPVVEYQSSDISSERMYSAWEDRWDELSREAEQDYA